MSSIEIPASEVMQEVILSVRFTGVKTMRARLWLASKIILVAALVAGCSIEVEYGDG